MTLGKNMHIRIHLHIRLYAPKKNLYNLFSFLILGQKGKNETRGFKMDFIFISHQNNPNICRDLYLH